MATKLGTLKQQVCQKDLLLFDCGAPVLRIKKRVIPEILNLSAVLGVKENEAGGKADFIEQDSAAGQNLAYARGVLSKSASNQSYNNAIKTL